MAPFRAHSGQVIQYYSTIYIPPVYLQCPLHMRHLLPDVEMHHICAGLRQRLAQALMRHLTVVSIKNYAEEHFKYCLNYWRMH